MAKEFERAMIEPNDDGTYTVVIEPVGPEMEEGAEPVEASEVAPVEPITVNSLDEAFAAIKGTPQTEETENGTSPEENMNRFFNGGVQRSEE